jgi:hypothetical protein
MGALGGDQVYSSVSVTTNGGYVVWEDNSIDGLGLGIGAQQLDANFSPRFGPFRVNVWRNGDQQKPQVAMLNKGGAAIVWQSGGQRFANINARFLNAGGTFTSTNDIRVNSTTNSDQVAPALTVMSNGNVLVVWSSWNYSVSSYFMQDIRAQVLTTNGTKVGTNFYVNGTNLLAPSEVYNQRSPAVATLANGNIVVAWVSENQDISGLEYQQGTNWVHIYARLLGPTGTPLGPEFRVNSERYSLCANPSVSATSDGGFIAAWSQRPLVRSTDGWDVYARSFNSTGGTANAAIRLNSTTYGDQFGPRLSRIGINHLAIWTSLGQDGSWEGVYGQFLSGGALSGTEFQVNTTTISRQMYPALGSDGVGRFLAVWSSFVADTSFDLYAQRYASGQPLPIPSAPFVSALSAYSLGVAWPPLLGFPLAYYEVYQDGAASATATTTNNMWISTGLSPGATHWFQTAFVLAGGQRSPLSPPATNKTWGVDLNGKFGTPDGLPDDWQLHYFGSKTSDWDGPNVDSDGDGASNWQEFLAGTDPRDPNSVLKVHLTNTSQGRRATWNTVAGCVYQLQASGDFVSWDDVGSPRLATGGTDSLLVPGTAGIGYYRVIRMQ